MLQSNAGVESESEAGCGQLCFAVLGSKQMPPETSSSVDFFAAILIALVSTLIAGFFVFLLAKTVGLL
jgi:hypothetical protein